jgi:dTDP-4-dehydrorhamnose 3,5-epimerase-like enzyme
MTEPDFVFQNDAGSLTQLVRSGWTQVNVVTSRAGAVRGGHYHKYNEEAFFVAEGKFRLIASRDGETETHLFGRGDMFVIPKYVAHTFQYLEDTTLVALYDRGVERDEHTKDIWPAL